MRWITTEHHLLPKSKGGSNKSINLIRLQDSFHKAFHRVFENKTPIEQLEYIKALNSNVLNVEVIHRIWDVLWEFKDPQYVYRKWVLVPKE